MTQRTRPHGFAVGSEKSRTKGALPMIGYILILILFALLGIAMIFRPHFFWTVSHWLSVRDGEPTDLYIWFVRISGSIFLVLAVVVIGILLFY